MNKSTLLAAMLLASLAEAKTIRIPGDADTLAAALEKAVPGDTILLAAGEHVVSAPLKIGQSVTVASRFLDTKAKTDIESCILAPARMDLDKWIELAGTDSRVVGITFRGSSEHTLDITTRQASVLSCRFLGGEDQVSMSRGGGRIAHCYFEGAGDDSIDCDRSVSWVIENNTIINAHQDGIEIRLHEKGAPLTTHVFRNNTVIGSGQSGLQLIDYQGDSHREFRIHNNLFLGCKGSGVSCMYEEKDRTNEVYRGSLMQERAYVYNNTFDGCNYGMTLAPFVAVLNNIFLNSKTRAIERGIYITNRLDHSIVDYCLFYGNAQDLSPGVRRGAKVIRDRNPQLGANHELMKGSPCIDAGSAKYSWENSTFTIPETDYQGAAPDLGAKESATPAKRLP